MIKLIEESTDPLEPYVVLRMGGAEIELTAQVNAPGPETWVSLHWKKRQVGKQELVQLETELALACAYIEELTEILGELAEVKGGQNEQGIRGINCGCQSPHLAGRAGPAH